MYRKSSMARAAKIVVTALFVTLFSIVNPAANADFYHASEMPLSSDGYYVYSAQSSTGSVIATTDGCEICASYSPDGYAYISTNGGATFTQKTSVGKQSWRGVLVSADGQRIALVTKSNFYISNNGGVDFSIAYSIPITDIAAGKTIIGAAISGDGKVIYFSVNPGIAMRLTYDQYSRRWMRTLNVNIPNYEYAETLATNSDGSKAYYASEQGSIYKIVGQTISAVPDTRLFADNSVITWSSIKTSDTGNEVIALPWNMNSTGIYYKSTNSGTSFSAVTTINGASFDPLTAIDISGDGNTTFLAAENNDGSLIYTQHGKTATWYERMQERYMRGYDEIETNIDGTNLIASRLYYILRIINALPEKPLIYGGSGIDDYAWIRWQFNHDVPTDAIQSINDMQVQYSLSSSGPWTTFNDGVLGGFSNWIKISGLSPLSNYYYRIRAQNSFGFGPWSDVTSGFIYKTPNAPAAPTQVVLSDKSLLYVVFNDATDLGGAAHIYNNDWQYSLDSGTTWINGEGSNLKYNYAYTNATYPYVRTRVLISDLTPGQPIMVRTSSYNGYNYGPWSSPGTFYVYRTPSAVSNFQGSTVGTTANLTWNPPTDLGGGTLLNYKYSYKKTTDLNWTEAFTGSQSATITGLQGGSTYDYKVQAVMANGITSLVAYVYNGQATNPPTKLSITRNSGVAKSSQAFSVQPKVSLLDSGNSVVTSESNALVIAEINNGGTLIGSDSVTAVSGVATFTNLGIKGKAGTQYTITYRSSNLTVATENVTLLPGSISAMKFETNTVGGVNSVIFSTQPQISIVDIDGNRVTSDETTTVTLVTSEGYLWDGSSSSPSARAVQGLVTFADVRATGGNGSTPVLTYSATGLTSLQETITVTTGPAYTFTRTVRAADAYVGGSFGTQPVYQVTDSSGNVVTTGEYLISISPSQGTLIGKTSVKTVNGVGTFTDLGITGVNASQLVILTVSSAGFNSYTGDSVITRQGHPVLNWSDYFIPRGSAPFTIPRPDSSTAGTFTYTSSDSGVISISGSTATVGSAGTATITATFTPSNTTNYFSGDTVTATFTVVPSNGTLVVAAAGGVARKGVNNTLTASASDDGTVTFYANGKKIAGCISLRTQIGVATCTWKPTVQGSVTLSALLIPTNSAVDAVKSAGVNVGVVRRTGLR